MCDMGNLQTVATRWPRRFGWPVFEVSTVAREGLRPLTFALWDMVKAYRDAQPEVAPRHQ